jgi:predicted aldo/keto reductase-like oxidoreductase
MKKLGFGFMRLPVTDPQDRSAVDYEKVKELVDAYMDRGFNYFDTAFKYCGGNSETAIRKAVVERYPRDQYILTTKLSNEFMHSKEEQEQTFQQQLDKLGVDYVDYYLLHNQGEVNYKVSQELDSFTFIQGLKVKGFVKHIGMSYHDNAELLDEILTAHPELDVVQLQINYLDWENESIQSRKCYEVCRKHQKPVLVMEPLKGGTLADVPEEAKALMAQVHPDWSPAAWALRFAASHPGILAVLSGMNEMTQLTDNMDALENPVPFTEQEKEVIQKAAQIIAASAMIPCTGCRYCTVTCPQNIPIPDYLSLLQEGHATTQVVYYYNLAQKNGRAKDCIQCGLCETHCPQHIAIRTHLKTVSEKYDGFKGWR